jgi:TatA/E family protein of Tat protein translocase
LDVGCPQPAAADPRGVSSGVTSRPVRQEKRTLGLRLPELLVILFIVILIFGANRLPDLAKGIGKSIKNFKEASKGGADEK